MILLFQPSCQQEAIWSISGSTWPPTWPPKPSRIRPKMVPKPIKNQAKYKSIFYINFKLIFYRFLSVLDPPKRAKIDNFFNLFEKVDFVKIIVLPWENWYFWGSEPLKSDVKSIPRHIRNKHCKKILKNLILDRILDSILGPCWAQKWKKVEQKLRWNFNRFLRGKRGGAPESIDSGSLALPV